MSDAHEGFTHMLFVDALIGLGLRRLDVAVAAEINGLADCTGTEHSNSWVWRRDALEALPLPELQDLYMLLKTYEVTHVG